jgi:hypothetical protein
MTTRTRHLRPLARAQKRRSILPAYFDLRGKGLFILVVLGASLLGLLALAQAGRTVSVGYQLKDLQKEEARLRWEKEDLLGQIAKVTDPETVQGWATTQGMTLTRLQDITFIPLPQQLPAGIDVQAPNASQPEGRLP